MPPRHPQNRAHPLTNLTPDRAGSDAVERIHQTYTNLPRPFLAREAKVTGSDLDQFPSRIRAVTKDEVNAAMRKHFFADKLHTIVAGDLEKLPE